MQMSARCDGQMLLFSFCHQSAPRSLSMLHKAAERLRWLDPDFCFSFRGIMGHGVGWAKGSRSARYLWVWTPVSCLMSCFGQLYIQRSLLVAHTSVTCWCGERGMEDLGFWIPWCEAASFLLVCSVSKSNVCLDSLSLWPMKVSHCGLWHGHGLISSWV